MREVQPRIFGVGVAGSHMAEPNRFRDWAMINGGNYTQLHYQGEMEVAFDRAATLMHRPASYTLEVTSEFRAAPGPGSLRVLAPEQGGAGGAAVELILDASGSMLQRIEGKRRIAIAKDVLTEAVREHIPAGTPVALRVFGDKEPDACRSDLEIPLAPLDPDAAAAKIAGIQAMNLARTPIADSLAAVKADLGGASGAVIVLVTDGEETCNGDPAKVIDALQAAGFHVNLNIVGFAIDDAELAAQFESWAAAASGRYFAANDESGLTDALEVALRIPFTVFDQGGNQVAEGEVGGDPVELEQGIYRVEVRSATPRTFDNVEVQGESEVTLQLD
jgi:von Willebrand factor type A domain